MARPLSRQFLLDEGVDDFERIEVVGDHLLRRDRELELFLDVHDEFVDAGGIEDAAANQGILIADGAVVVGEEKILDDVLFDPLPMLSPCRNFERNIGSTPAICGRLDRVRRWSGSRMFCRCGSRA
jgi:hypothetical protein